MNCPMCNVALQMTERQGIDKIAHIAEEKIKDTIKAELDVVVHIEPLGSEAD